jgi:hypothetical protein
MPRGARKKKGAGAVGRGGCRTVPLSDGGPRDRRHTLRLTEAQEALILEAAAAQDPPECFSTFTRKAAVARADGKASPCAGAAAGEAAGERCGTLYTPAGAEGACYEVVEADAIITSHNPFTWEPDPRYPRAVQERDYRGDKNEQAKVHGIASNPLPDLLLLPTPTAVDGAPVLASSRVALGGNGRAMGLRLAYEHGTADEYREQLAARAPTFGLSRAQVEALSRPVLVRTVKGLDNASQAELADASSRYNEGLTNGLDERARAVSLSRRLSAATLAAIGRELEQHEALRAAMAASGPVFVQRLVSDGIITDQRRAEYVDDQGGLTEAGKVLVEGAFLGLAAGTPERLAQASPGTLQKLERLVPFLARVKARDNGHDLIPLVQAALDLLYAAQVARAPVRRHAAQVDMLSAPPAPEVVRLAELLEDLTGKKLAAAAQEWASVADYDKNQRLMFEEHPSAQEVREVFFTAAKVKAAA